MPTRNFCVARGTAAANTNSTVYTVPNGHSFILKNIACQAAVAGTTSMSLALTKPDNSLAVFFVSNTYPSTQVLNLNLWTVLNAGDKLLFGSIGTQSYYWISGALLPYEGVLPPTPTEASLEQGPPWMPPAGPAANEIRVIP